MYNQQKHLGYVSRALGVGAVALALAATGCHGKRISSLEKQVSAITDRQDRTDASLNTLANSPNAEKPIYLVKGKGYDDIIEEVKRKIISLYDDKVPPGDKTKLIAEEHGNAVRLIPTHNGMYTAKIMHDNGDSIAGKGDFVLPDDIGNGKLKDNILLLQQELPEQVRYWLLHSEELILINQDRTKP